MLSVRSVAYIQLGSGCWPPKSSLGTQLMAELAGQPSSSHSILLTYGPATGEQRGDRERCERRQIRCSKTTTRRNLILEALQPWLFVSVFGDAQNRLSNLISVKSQIWQPQVTSPKIDQSPGCLYHHYFPFAVTLLNFYLTSLSWMGEVGIQYGFGPH